MSPEFRDSQLRALYGDRVDVWALGCTLVWLFSGDVVYSENGSYLPADMAFYRLERTPNMRWGFRMGSWRSAT